MGGRGEVRVGAAPVEDAAADPGWIVREGTFGGIAAPDLLDELDVGGDEGAGGEEFAGVLGGGG